MSDDADDADETERAEAAALAAALEGEAGARPPPEDALATALLMRHGGDRGQLSAERADAILHDVLRDGAREPARRATVVRLWPAFALLAAAAAAALIVRDAQQRSSAPAVVASAPHPQRAPAAPAIPPASPRLLAAHSTLLDPAWAQQPDANERADRFDRELRAYRHQLFRTLESAYPAKLGLLEPALARTLRARRSR